MIEMNVSIQRALKAGRMFPRPHGGPGLWSSFLLPVAVISSGFQIAETTSFYLACCLYSFNTLLNVLFLLFHIIIFNSTNVVKGINVLSAIPALISATLYSEALKLGFWKCLCHAVANGLIYFEGIPFLFKAFPHTFTFGEANIVIQAFSLLVYSLIVRLDQISVEGVSELEYFLTTVILQLTVSWVIVFCIVPFAHPALRQVKFVYTWGLTVLGCIYLSVYKVLNQDLVLWMWNFLTKPGRVAILVLWLICSATAVVLVQHQVSKGKKSNTVVRKSFHVLATIVFLTGTFLDASLTYFSSGCVFCLFVVLEAFRLLRLPPLHEFLQSGFLAYRDEKDSGNLAMTPICLLVGNALPFWLHPSVKFSSENHLQLLSGVISVGIGDTFASVGGKLFGKHFWKGSKKTVEGTFFCILSQVIFIQVLVYFDILVHSYKFQIKAFIAVLVISIIEAKTDQIDNIVLPLTMYILLLI